MDIVQTDTLGELLDDSYVEDFIIHSEIPEDEELFELYDLKVYLEGYLHRIERELSFLKIFMKNLIKSNKLLLVYLVILYLLFST